VLSEPRLRQDGWERGVDAYPPTRS
jgi:hypothetical protein